MENFFHWLLVGMLIVSLLIAAASGIASRNDAGSAMPVHGMLCVIFLIISFAIAVVLYF